MQRACQQATSDHPPQLHPTSPDHSCHPTNQPSTFPPKRQTFPRTQGPVLVGATPRVARVGSAPASPLATRAPQYSYPLLIRGGPPAAGGGEGAASLRHPHPAPLHTLFR